MEVSIQHKETNKPQLLLTAPRHQSLTDGDIITPENHQATNPIWSGPDPGLSLFGPCGSSSSGWSTPIGSEPGSTETESEEDEFIAELTRQMADYMLAEEEEDDDDDEENSIPQNHPKPNPPITGLQSSQHLTDNQIKSIQFYQMKNRELLKKQGSVGRGRKGKMNQSTQKSEPKHHQKMEKNRGGGGRVNPRQVGSGMTAVFLGESVLKSGCPGTGVFLPRGIGSNPTETTTRSKPRCSTVLIPAKVIQALQLHYNQMNVQLRSKGNPTLQAKWMNDDDRSCLGEREEEPQKQHLQPDHDQSKQLKKKNMTMMDHHHMGLPQEWTY